VASLFFRGSLPKSLTHCVAADQSVDHSRTNKRHVVSHHQNSSVSVRPSVCHSGHLSSLGASERVDGLTGRAIGPGSRRRPCRTRRRADLEVRLDRRLSSRAFRVGTNAAVTSATRWCERESPIMKRKRPRRVAVCVLDELPLLHATSQTYGRTDGRTNGHFTARIRQSVHTNTALPRSTIFIIIRKIYCGAFRTVTMRRPRARQPPWGSSPRSA